MIKTIVPDSIRRLRVRLRWFLRHYASIGNDSMLVTDELHGPATYGADGLITSNNADFIKDARFGRAYARAAATNPWPGFNLQWRVHVVCWFAEQCARLPGDFVECGVNTGAYAAAVTEYVGFSGLQKTFYLLDTFEGLDPAMVSEEEKKAGISNYFGAYRDVYEQVIRTFSSFPNVRVIKGRVPDTLSLCGTERVSFLSIDMNCVAPEIAAAEYFWPKLVSGGVIVLDDYGFPAHIHQKKAFDDFAARKAVSILSLPTGQAIILKP